MSEIRSYHPEIESAIDGVVAAAHGVGPSPFERAVVRLLGMLSKHRVVEPCDPETCHGCANEALTADELSSAPEAAPPALPPIERVEAARAKVDRLRARFESYGGGDRPPSPPAELMRELRDAERELAAAVEARREPCPESELWP